MDTIERLVKDFNEDTLPDVAVNDPHNLLPPAHTEKPLSKYAAKKLALVEEVKNAFKIKSNKAVATEESKKHKKVSRNLLLAMRNEQMTVVCEETGIVAVLNIPVIKDKVLTWESPLASLPNARGIVQEGYDYLNSLDTQIISGLFITLAREYDLIRTMVDQSGAVTNAILRTASKEKLIQACLLVESYIHSLNHVYQPKLSLVYDAELKDNGCEPRLTEWMRLVNEAIERPDLSEYDENALLDKPMRSIADLKKEHSARVKEEKRVSSLKDKNFKERAAFRKDIKEAKTLISNMKDSISQKMVSFMKQLFTEESFLTVDKALLGQLSVKLETVEHASAKRLIEIIAIDRTNLRKETMIDDLDDPLMAAVDKIEKDIAAERAEGSQEQEYVDAMDYADSIEEQEGEAEEQEHSTQQQYTIADMPVGLTFAERVRWKNKHGVK